MDRRVRPTIYAGPLGVPSTLKYVLLPLLFLFLTFPSCATIKEATWEGVTVTGTLLDENLQPVQSAHVYAYHDGKSNTLGPADAMSEPTGADGAYILILPEGTYTLIARRRLSGSISGPLKNGDMSGLLTKPFRAASGDRTGVDITVKKFRQGSEGDPKRILTTNTRIRGIVVDTNGAAISGVNVFAYKGSFRQGLPDYMAPTTDPEGRFEISLPGGGEYTVGARTRLGGKPGPDDSIGFWGERDPPRRIEEGSVTEGVKIVLEPYVDAEKD